MVTLVDPSLISAMDKILARSTASTGQAWGKAGQGIADLGTGFIKRGQAAKSKREQIDAYDKALQRQKEDLERQKSDLMNVVGDITMGDTGELAQAEIGPRQKIATDAQIRSIDKRIGEIGAVQSQLPDIGEVTFSKHDQILPAIGARQDYDPSAEYKDLETQAAAERAAALEAKRLQEREEDIQRDQEKTEAARQHQLRMQREALAAKPPKETTEERKKAQLSAKREEQYRANAEGAVEFKRKVAELNGLIETYGDDLFGTLQGGKGFYEGAAKFFGTDVAKARDRYDSIMSSLELDVAKMKLKGSGQVTEAERKIARDTTPDRGATDASVAKEIIKQLNDEADEHIYKANVAGIDYIGAKSDEPKNKTNTTGWETDEEYE